MVKLEITPEKLAVLRQTVEVLNEIIREAEGRNVADDDPPAVNFLAEDAGTSEDGQPGR